ncbi:MAG: hypothetical protein AAFP17_19725, partial [Pseudomonadota bacterium]
VAGASRHAISPENGFSSPAQYSARSDRSILRKCDNASPIILTNITGMALLALRTPLARFK